MSTLRKVVLRDQVREFILERILTGVYVPGQRLVETQIARELECSQAPVREALRDLEQLGCVHYEPNRGCSVQAFSEADLAKAYPARAVLGGTRRGRRPAPRRRSTRRSCATRSRIASSSAS